MRILTAPGRVALAGSSPVTLEFVVHNDTSEDGVAFPTFVADDDVAEACFEPALGFLAAGTAQRFQVELHRGARCPARAPAQWVLFAGGILCERRPCEIIAFDGVQTLPREPVTPTIDPQRKAQILALARAPCLRCRLPAALLAALLLPLCFVSGALRLNSAPNMHRAQPHSRVAITRLPRRRAMKSTPALRQNVVVHAVPPAHSEPLHAKRTALAAHSPRAMRVARWTQRQVPLQRPPRAKRLLPRVPPPLLTSILVAHEVCAGSEMTIGVLGLRAQRVRIAVKLGPVVLIDRTFAANAATLRVSAPSWAGHVQLLTVRAWVKNAGGSASGYATVAIVPNGASLSSSP